jgi:hypothetical protein
MPIPYYFPARYSGTQKSEKDENGQENESESTARRGQPTLLGRSTSHMARAPSPLPRHRCDFATSVAAHTSYQHRNVHGCTVKPVLCYYTEQFWLPIVHIAYLRFSLQMHALIAHSAKRLYFPLLFEFVHCLHDILSYRRNLVEEVFSSSALFFQVLMIWCIYKPLTSSHFSGITYKPQVRRTATNKPAKPTSTSHSYQTSPYQVHVPQDPRQISHDDDEASLLVRARSSCPRRSKC